MLSLFSFKERNARYWISELVEVWNTSMPVEFSLSVDLLERNVFHSPYLNLGRSCLLLDDDEKVQGFLIGKSDRYGVLHGKDQPNRFWISCIVVHPDFQRNGYGGEMVRKALAGDDKDVQKFQECHVGTDPHHFFPGIPNDLDNAKTFFKGHGFDVSGEAYDLAGDLVNGPDKLIVHDDATAFAEYDVRRLHPTDQRNLFCLIEENFSLRWLVDTKWSLLYEKNITSMIGLFHHTKLIGFTHVHSIGDSFWIPSVYWEKGGNPNIGGLGPVGISKEYRGKGLGALFMGKALGILRKEGVKKMVIDWTILLDFYGQFGFRPFRKYVHAQKMIDES
ncbi:GNAT family N-acetyltransferase [Evansella tamaricis]|uniref:GNAT family N-acetyltransferase n=1 Tax=Evansella tamaricis TaxID=2069301 RepID=A0ABS6JGC0_9BACI|nr:GNAT family N-acetyltransferase [Evansella tamaricis]MBU9712709.1 GNAT family N-acetyltransferase [Evansella tamaricis]